MNRKAVQVLKTKVGLLSNEPELIDPSQFYLLDTNFREVEVIDFAEDLDAYLILNQVDGLEPTVHVGSNRAVVSGDIARMKRNASDPRYNPLGNLGLFSRYTLSLLESNYNIFSFHAASFYDPDHEKFIIVIGGAGSGKTCFLLTAIEEGIRIFATEFTHIQMPEDGPPVFHKGALLDNIRVGNLKYDYPEAREKLGVDLPSVDDEWGEQVWQVDMTDFQTSFDAVEDPEIIIVLPHIERNWGEIRTELIEDKSSLRESLFDNITEKVATPFLLGSQLPLPGLETQLSGRRRYDAMGRFLEKANIQKVVKLTGGTQTKLQEVIT